MSQQDESMPGALDSTALINAHERKQQEVNARANAMAIKELQQFNSSYLQRILCSIDDDSVRQLACDLVTDNMPQLSKIHSQFAVILDERDKLLDLVPERLYNWKNAILVQRINQLKLEIAQADAEQLQDLYKIRHELAAFIGDRVVNPN